MCVLHLKKQHEEYSFFHNAGKTFKFCIKKSINLHSLSLELDGGREGQCNERGFIIIKNN